MDGSDGMLLWIDEKNRDAVGGLNAEEQARLSGGGGVAAAGIGGSGLENVHGIRVKLF